MEPEPNISIWPPAPKTSLPPPNPPKPRLLTGRRNWDDTLGWAGSVGLVWLVVLGYNTSIRAVFVWLRFAGIDPFSLSKQKFELLLLTPIAEMLCVSLLIYVTVRGPFPILAKQFKFSTFFFLGMGLAGFLLMRLGDIFP